VGTGQRLILATASVAWPDTSSRPGMPAAGSFLVEYDHFSAYISGMGSLVITFTEMIGLSYMTRSPQFSSCPDLIRASTPFLAAPEDVDDRVKPGHDDPREASRSPNAKAILFRGFSIAIPVIHNKRVCRKESCSCSFPVLTGFFTTIWRARRLLSCSRRLYRDKNPLERRGGDARIRATDNRSIIAPSELPHPLRPQSSSTKDQP